MKTMTIEQGIAHWYNPEVTPEYFEAVQRFINDGLFSTGSDCTRNYEAIDAGWCLWPKRGGRMGYITVPGRDDVEPGEPGSYDYVVEKMGKTHADAMASIGGFDRSRSSSPVGKRIAEEHGLHVGLDTGAVAR